MSILDNFRAGILNWLIPTDSALYERMEAIEQRRSYRHGWQRPQMRVKPNQADDNIYLNYTGLVVDRAVAMLFGSGVEFDLPEEESVQQEYLEMVWDANKQEILLHKLAYFGAEAGTCYVKFIPDGLGTGVTRLVAVDPIWVTMDANPDDMEDIVRYIIQYATVGQDGKELARKQVIEKQETTWAITDYTATNLSGGRWTQTGPVVTWPWSWAPVMHWQNLPAPDSVYGQPDITEDVLRLQDRINFVAGNISKIIRLYAHPQRWGRGLGTMNSMDVGPDKIIGLNGAEAGIWNLEMQSDLGSSQAYLDLLTRTLMQVTQTTDISTVQDKLGSLTNFGIRMLFYDSLNRLGVKRELYGDALETINAHLLEIGGYAGADPGEVVWSDPLPANDTEQIAAMKSDLEMGIVSKGTASERRGYDWDSEQERMSNDRVEEDNIGAMILRNFRNGQ